MQHKRQGQQLVLRYRQVSYARLVDSYPASACARYQLENQLRQRQLQLKQEQLRHLQDLNHDKKNIPLKISLYPLQ